MLSNIDLDKMATTEGISLVGIFSKDELPPRPRNGNYIINLQDADDGNGTHWSVFKIFPNKKCCYFDSYGIFAPTDVNEFLSPFKPIATSNRAIQDIKSQKCGYFCLAFIEYFNNFDYKKNDVYDAFDDFLNSFSNNPKQNDKIVMEMLNKY